MVSTDLRALNDVFSRNALNSQGWNPNPDELRDFGSNWEYIIKHEKDAEERLLRRLSEKTEEITSLRDGVL